MSPRDQLCTSVSRAEGGDQVFHRFGESPQNATCDWARIRKQPVLDFLDKYSKIISFFQEINLMQQDCQDFLKPTSWANKYQISLKLKIHVKYVFCSIHVEGRKETVQRQKSGSEFSREICHHFRAEKVKVHTGPFLR